MFVLNSGRSNLRYVSEIKYRGVDEPEYEGVYPIHLVSFKHNTLRHVTSSPSVISWIGS